MYQTNCSNGCGRVNYFQPPSKDQSKNASINYLLGSGIDISEKLDVKDDSLLKFSQPDASDYQLNVGGGNMQTHYFNPESELSGYRTMGQGVNSVAYQVISTHNLGYAGGSGGSSGGGS